MKFVVYWKHGKTDCVEGQDLKDAFTKQGWYMERIQDRISFVKAEDEKSCVWDKAHKTWVVKPETSQTENKVQGKTCMQYMQWVFREWYKDAFKSFDPIPKGGSAKDLSNGEIRRLFESKCIQINGDFFEAQEELPPIVYSLVLFPNNQRMRNTLI